MHTCFIKHLVKRYNGFQKVKLVLFILLNNCKLMKQWNNIIKPGRISMMNPNLQESAKYIYLIRN